MNNLTKLAMGLALAGCAAHPYQARVDQTNETLNRWQTSQVNAAKAIADCTDRRKELGYKDRYDSFQKCGYPKAMDIVRASGFPYMADWGNFLDSYGDLAKRRDSGAITLDEARIEGERLIDGFNEKKNANIQKDVWQPLQQEIQAFDSNELVRRQAMGAALNQYGQQMLPRSQQQPEGFQNINCTSHSTGAFMNTNCQRF